MIPRGFRCILPVVHYVLLLELELRIIDLDCFKSLI